MSSRELTDVLRERAPLAYGVLSALEAVMHVSEEEFDAACDEVEDVEDRELLEFFLHEAMRLEERAESMSADTRKVHQTAYRAEAVAVLRVHVAPTCRWQPSRATHSPRASRARRSRRRARSPARLSAGDDPPEQPLAGSRR